MLSEFEENTIFSVKKKYLYSVTIIRYECYYIIIMPSGSISNNRVANIKGMPSTFYTEPFFNNKKIALFDVFSSARKNIEPWIYIFFFICNLCTVYLL